MAKIVMMVVCLVLACMVVAAPHAQAAMTCGQVISGLAPCIGYLMKGGPVPPSCCDSLRGLNNAAKSTPDRQAACGCLKGVYASNSGINLSYASSLPGKCGINIPYNISPSTDCSKVH